MVTDPSIMEENRGEADRITGVLRQTGKRSFKGLGPVCGDWAVVALILGAAGHS